jgi:hypothetical protein
MTVNGSNFDPSEFCSRKLWQLVNDTLSKDSDDCELQEAINELATRRHYLAELQELGKLKP